MLFSNHTSCGTWLPAPHVGTQMLASCPCECKSLSPQSCFPLLQCRGPQLLLIPPRSLGLTSGSCANKHFDSSDSKSVHAEALECFGVLGGGETFSYAESMSFGELFILGSHKLSPNPSTESNKGWILGFLQISKLKKKTLKSSVVSKRIQVVLIYTSLHLGCLC